MEKQAKVLNKIKNSLVHGNEGQLGTKKNDECYTGMQDILNELSYWSALGKFQGKRIVCPCDWDITDDENIYSIEITYKEDSVDVNAFKAVKSVVITKITPIPSFPLYTEETAEEVEQTKWEQIELAEDEIEDFLRNKLTCNFVRTLTQNARRWGIKSITASGFNPANNRGIKFQDVDYSKYDICITNPPFSLYGEFMKAIVDKIDFIILAPFLNRTGTSVAIPLMEQKAYLGRGRHLALSFKNPTKENGYSGEKSVACDWVTSFPEAQNELNQQQFHTGIKYDLYKDEYPIMPKMTMRDGTHPIKVGVSTYPDDYSGWMFGPIGILDNLNQAEYEWYATNCSKYFNTMHPELNPCNHKLTNGELLIGSDGKRAFSGLLFRKKPQVSTNNE